MQLFEQENLEAAHRCLDFGLSHYNKIICNQGICLYISYVQDKTGLQELLTLDKEFLGNNRLKLGATSFF